MCAPSVFIPYGCSHTVPHKKIRCTIPEGIGRSLDWKVVVDKQPSVRPTTSYGKPEIYFITHVSNTTNAKQSGISIVNAHTSGGEEIRIVGKNFGAYIEYLEGVWYGCKGALTYKFQNCVLEKPHTQLRCETPPGVGSYLDLTIAVGGQTQDLAITTPFPQFSYQSPIITSILRKGDETNPLLGGTTYGQYSFKIHGKYLGTIGFASSPVSKRLVHIIFESGSTNNNFEVFGKDVLYSSESNEVVEFNIPEGQGQRIRVKIRHTAMPNSNQCMSESESLYYSYKDPMISRIKASPNRTTVVDNKFPVVLSMYGENVGDDGIYPNPVGVFDNGGSFGKASSIGSGNSLKLNKVGIYRGVDRLLHAGNLTVSIQSTQTSCAAKSYSHNKIVCDVIASNVDEDVVKSSLIKEQASPEVISKNLAELKANKVSAKLNNQIVLGADSVIDLDGELISKPENREGALTILKKLNNKSHFLISSVCISLNGSMIWNYTDKAHLTMKNFSDKQLGEYLEKITDEALYAYNVYQIEGEGRNLFTSIDGDENTVMGLPINDIKNYLDKFK